jgi:hypothetical protein
MGGDFGKKVPKTKRATLFNFVDGAKKYDFGATALLH